jgi:hypothetical protein
VSRIELVRRAHVDDRHAERAGQKVSDGKFLGHGGGPSLETPVRFDETKTPTDKNR